MALMPAKNMKRVIPRVCSTCDQGSIDGTCFVCQRPDGLNCEILTFRHIMTTCDCYKQHPLYQQEKRDEARVRRSQGAKEGWEIRRAKQAREET